MCVRIYKISWHAKKSRWRGNYLRLYRDTSCLVYSAVGSDLVDFPPTHRVCLTASGGRQQVAAEFGIYSLIQFPKRQGSRDWILLEEERNHWEIQVISLPSLGRDEVDPHSGPLNQQGHQLFNLLPSGKRYGSFIQVVLNNLTLVINHKK